MAQSPSPSDQFGLAVPAHRFVQGGRYVYSFILDLATLDDMLPDRVDENVIKEANRRLTPSHAQKIREYLESNEKWLLGTLLMGIDPEEVEFQPLQETNRAVVAGMLRIRAVGSVKIFDGQHRRRAIEDALASLSQNRTKGDRLASLREASVPIMLYGESSIDALRQMFTDAAQTKTIERNTVAQFDMSDAFNRAADQLLGISDFLSGRVEIERASVSRTSPNIIAINQLAAALKTVEVGITGRVSKAQNVEYMAALDDLVDRCWAWSDEFMPAAREEYDDLLAGEIDNSDIPELRSHTMAFNATLIRVLAGCYHEWMKKYDNWEPLANFIRSTSLIPGAGEGALLVDAGLVIPGGITPIARMHRMTDAIEFVVSQAEDASC